MLDSSELLHEQTAHGPPINQLMASQSIPGLFFTNAFSPFPFGDARMFQPHPSMLKSEHKKSRAARRGPMDEMRQIVRIFVKMLPDSRRFLMTAESDEGNSGGGK